MTSDVKKRKVAITGIGVFSPIGIGREEFLQNLNAGKSGIAPMEYYSCTSTPGGIGGEVKGFNEDSAKKIYLKQVRKSIKLMSRETQLGTAVAFQALEDSKINLEEIVRERIGVDYGANLMFFTPDSMADAVKACQDENGKFIFSKWGTTGMAAMEPLWMLRYLPNMPACHIAITTDSRGPSNSVTLDEASPGVALTEALNIIERDAADVMIVGGTGTRIHPVRAIHAKLVDPLAFDESDPSKSSKPFDQNRSGQVVSEGAGCFILEEEEHAKGRGAHIYGYLLSGSSSCVATPEGVADVKAAVVHAVNSALRRAGLKISDIGHINAHGVATLEADQAEAAALRELIGDLDIPVTALKGFFGNAGAASGFFEISASLLSLNDSGSVPPVLNLETPDESVGLNLVQGKPQAVSNKKFLNINFTRPGQASVVIVEAA
ncbi:beta-ketoacyl-[acyl-carrier-protein] synthase family protein [Planctomicrobium sp. SH668]|uniref:beta-ketoacyl-[acyl-carrier-protein] synthase family protein n=1 Tax=Planctomicrobium sp. SH668 TaxID=3448126 RepID=UPI003F5C95B0